MILTASEIPQNDEYSGKDLTFIYNIEELSDLVKNGEYENLGIGDYITKSITVNGNTTIQNFRIAAFNWFVGHGDIPLEQNHLIMIPEGYLCYSIMNSLDTTAGGYVGSYMYKTTMPLVTTGLQKCFGDKHILPYRSLLSNSNDAGNSTSYDWYTVYCNLCSVVQVYNSDDKNYDEYKGNKYDQGDGKIQLPLFKLNSNLKFISKTTWWLSTVSTVHYFLFAYCGGYPIRDYPHTVRTVRPLFLFY